METTVDIDQQIQEIQEEITNHRKNVIALRQKRQPEPVSNYTFKNRTGESVTLEDLFGDNDELLIIHNMGKSCVYCTMWADGFRGIREHLADRMPFVLVSPDEVEVHKEFVEGRNWDYNTVSAHGNTFIKDLGFEQEKDGKIWYWPGCSALIKNDDGIFRVAKDFFGPGDAYNAAWHFFDLFPKGVNGWQPKYKY